MSFNKGRLTYRYCIFLCIFLLPLVAFGQEAGDKNFKDFINQASDGSSFKQTISLENECDYTACKTRDCARQVFRETIARQEYDYVSRHYGRRGKDWELAGYDSVDVYEFTNDRHFDDLGIQIFSTAKKIVLHFDITSSVHALEHFEYSVA